MLNDPIVDEIHRLREAYAAQFNYDLQAIYRDLKEKEKASGRTFVHLPPKPAEPADAEVLPIIVNKRA